MKKIIIHSSTAETIRDVILLLSRSNTDGKRITEIITGFLRGTGVISKNEVYHALYSNGYDVWTLRVLTR